MRWAGRNSCVVRSLLAASSTACTQLGDGSREGPAQHMRLLRHGACVSLHVCTPCKHQPGVPGVVLQRLYLASDFVAEHLQQECPCLLEMKGFQVSGDSWCYMHVTPWSTDVWEDAHKRASSRNRPHPTQQMIQLARRQSCCTHMSEDSASATTVLTRRSSSDAKSLGRYCSWKYQAGHHSTSNKPDQAGGSTYTVAAL